MHFVIQSYYEAFSDEKIAWQRESRLKNNGNAMIELKKRLGLVRGSPLTTFSRKSGKGFTLIELLVVISIIGMLSSIVLASLNSARSKAKVANAVSQIHEMRTIVAMYVTDTNRLPPGCGLSCTSATDPYQNALGVPGWSGPYFPTGVWNLRHPWGGQFTIDIMDVTGDSTVDLFFFLDDDTPGSSGDNAGQIPQAEMLAIDARLDDGNLATGNVRGNGGFLTAPVGELVVILSY